jgi:hypothetical protein
MTMAADPSPGVPADAKCRAAVVAAGAAAFATWVLGQRAAQQTAADYASLGQRSLEIERGTRMGRDWWTERQRERLVQIAKDAREIARLGNPEDVADKIVDRFCDITPPPGISRVVIGDSRGARNSKAGNILLSWKRLLVNTGVVILLIVDTASVPPIAPALIWLAGLVIWDRMYSMADIKIDSRHAIVLWIMWQNRDNRRKIGSDVIPKLVTRELDKMDEPDMSSKELKNILLELEKIRCIKLIEGKYWLREWVRIEM